MTPTIPAATPVMANKRGEFGSLVCVVLAVVKIRSGRETERERWLVADMGRWVFKWFGIAS